MKRAIIAIAAILAVVAVCEGRTITVDDDGAADFSTIQAAINDSNDGDTVLVADGTYTGDGNRDIDFHGKAITVKSENGPETCIIDCNGISAHRGFCFENGEDANSILDGFTIINGFASPGGGIRCVGNSPTILNCWIIGCSAGWGGRSSYGGGICCDDGYTIIKNCRIIGNTAAGGGGISGWGAIVVDCIISGNSAEFGGGLERVQSITNCTISGNTATERGGGVWMAMVITNCNIIGNSATVRGGGVGSCQGYITNCTFAENRAFEGNALVGRCSSSGNGVEITNCIFRDGGIEIWNEGSGEIAVGYSNVQGGEPEVSKPGRPSSILWGEGNIDADPCFADPGYWDANGTPDDANDDFWVGGDYHLKSQGGRWDANEGGWTTDDVTSPCVDAGDPMSPIGPEPFPNGGIINMGAYGGTTEASKSHFGVAPCETIVAGDINGNCVVDFEDFRLMASHWLECTAPPPESHEKYFPLHVGNSWTYVDCNDGSTKTFTIIGTEEVNGHTYYKFDDYFSLCWPQVTWEREVLFRYDSASDRVLMYLSGKEVTRYDFSGDLFFTLGDGLIDGHLVQTGVTCNVPAGQFSNCYNFKFLGIDYGPDCYGYGEYLGPNAGNVKYVVPGGSFGPGAREGDTVTFELQSYTIISD